MGHKANPIGLRLQINRTWDSRWFARGNDYGTLLLEDLRIREFIVKTHAQAAISKVVIERPAKPSELTWLDTWVCASWQARRSPSSPET